MKLYAIFICLFGVLICGNESPNDSHLMDSRGKGWMPVSFLNGEAASVSSVDAEVGETKYEELKALATPKNNFVVRLDSESYKYFVLKAPRPYQLIILFGTIDVKRCILCKDLAIAFYRIAAAYHSHSASHEGDLPVVFAFFDLLEETQYAALHQIETLPLIVAVTHKSFVKQGKTVRFRNEDVLTAPMIMSSSDVNFITSKVLQWVNMRTWQDVEIKEKSRFKILNIFILFFLVSLAIYVAIKSSSLAKRYPVLLRIGGIVVYFLSISGIFFSLQHGANWFDVDRNTGKGIFISRQYRSQTFSEGLLMAACTVGVGLLQVLLMHSLKLQHSKLNKSLRIVVYTTILLLWIFLFVVTLNVYTYKAEWYAPSFFPPPSFKKGSLRIDRGYS